MSIGIRGSCSPGAFGKRGNSIGELPENDGFIGGEPPLRFADEGEPLQGREAVAGTGARRPAAQPEEGKSPRAVRKMCRGLEQGGIEGSDIGWENPFGHKPHTPR